MRLPFNIEIRGQDVATIINLLFGTLAILFLVEAYSQNTLIAAAFVLICVLADGADGILARNRGQGSLGFQLDSLADFISFGLLPSILMYYVVRDATGNRNIFFLIFIISFFYTVCGMLRLARYTLTPQESIFYGLPITAGGLIIALYVLAGLPPIGLLIVTLILAVLMISEIKYPKIRNTLTQGVVGVLIVVVLVLYAIGTSYSIAALLLLLLSIAYILNPLYRGVSKMNDREQALFEAGIKLGALYHQYVGAPLDLNTIPSLEKAIQESIRVQPYVENIIVSIDKERVSSKLNKFGYAELEGKMLDVELVVNYGSAKVLVKMQYDEDADYPLMFIER